jgi:hypothetical protein
MLLVGQVSYGFLYALQHRFGRLFRAFTVYFLVRLLYGPSVRTRLLKGSFHFSNGDQGGSVIHGVHLLTVTKAFVNALYAGQPLQGFLTDIISLNRESHFGNPIRS